MPTFDEIKRINAEVNKIPYMREFHDDWRPAATDFIGALDGADCDSYATLKMLELVKAEQPLDTLRLAVCKTETGEDHCVLLVDFDGETWVLDNRRPEPVLMERAGYQWIEVQSASSPTGWEFA